MAFDGFRFGGFGRRTFPVFEAFAPAYYYYPQYYNPYAYSAYSYYNPYAYSYYNPYAYSYAYAPQYAYAAPYFFNQGIGGFPFAFGGAGGTVGSGGTGTTGGQH